MVEVNLVRRKVEGNIHKKVGAVMRRWESPAGQMEIWWRRICWLNWRWIKNRRKRGKWCLGRAVFFCALFVVYNRIFCVQSGENAVT